MPKLNKDIQDEKNKQRIAKEKELTLTMFALVGIILK